MVGPFLFFVFLRVAAGAAIDSGLSCTPCRRSRAHCSKLRHKEQDGGKAANSHLQKRSRAYGLQMESICEDDCNQIRFPKRGNAK